MFRGDDVGLTQAMRRATEGAARLGHPRVGSEHLLLALVEDRGPLVEVCAAHGAGEQAVRNVVVAAAPAGAGAAADRDMLRALGISVDGLISSFGALVVDAAPMTEPLFPLRARRARERCARSTPRLGLDAQAAYEASLRLAVGRRERGHRAEHLALALIALDPGVAWVLAGLGADRRRLLSDLATAFPPPARDHWLARATAGIGQRRRSDRIVRRYQHTSGRPPVSPTVALTLLGG